MAKMRKPKKTLISQIVGPSVQKYSHREKMPAGSSIQARKMSSKLKFAICFSAVALSIAVAAVAQNTVLKGKALKELEVKSNASLIDKYGDAANDPGVADALRKAQGNNLTSDEIKAKTEAYEALQNGVWTPGADPTMALMYGYVPPNMSPEQAQMLSRMLPKLPRMPHPTTPEDIARMAGEPESERTAIEPASPYVPYPESFAKAHGMQTTRQLQRIPQQTFPGQMAGMPELPFVPGMPMMGSGSGMGYGLSREEIAAQNQWVAEECIRARFGPVNIPTLQPGHNALAEQARKNASSQHDAESDHQSTVGVCDNNGDEITSIQYDPWGQPTVLKGTVMPTFMYQGMYWHDRSKKYLTLNRVYDPALGRWLSRDPLGEAAGTNLYAYVRNNPISYRDPLGLDVWIEGSGGYPEPVTHQSINVGDPNGAYYSQSFGVAGWNQSAVYVDPVHGGVIENYAKSTPQQDLLIQQQLRKDLGPTPGYNVFTNQCRTYSQNKFNSIVKQYGLTPSVPPDRPIQPWAYTQLIAPAGLSSTTSSFIVP